MPDPILEMSIAQSHASDDRNHNFEKYFCGVTQKLKRYISFGDISVLMCRNGQGMEKSRVFCPDPACPVGQPCGTVLRNFVLVLLVPQICVPVPVPRDTKSAGTDWDSRRFFAGRDSPVA